MAAFIEFVDVHKSFGDRKILGLSDRGALPEEPLNERVLRAFLGSACVRSERWVSSEPSARDVLNLRTTPQQEETP